MALYSTNYNSFASVVAHYEGIKPVREKNLGTSRDIRPIGDRTRKHERIVKLSRNCYALSDGYHRGDPVFQRWIGKGGKMEYYAPIVWRKHRDGAESVRIMNMTGPDNGCETSRYDFIRRNTPRGLDFLQGNARQYISMSGLREGAIFLAKGKTVPADEQKYYEDSIHYPGRHSWSQRKDDNAALVFTRDGGNWIHNPTTGKEVPKGPQVNKELKAKYRGALKKFFEWGMTMSPLLPLEQQYIMERMDELRKHFYPTTGYQPWNPEWSRAILVDEDHPMRLHLWVQFASQATDGYGWNPSYLVKDVQTKDDLRRVRARFNSFFNANAGFMKEHDTVVAHYTIGE